MKPLILDRLTKSFGDVVAVRDVSLEVRPGELFFLLGPSGCGKTTLLRLVAGFYHPDEGRVLFGDDDVTARPPHRRNCGMVFQNYALWPHMTVLENVTFGLAVRKVPRSERRRRGLDVLSIVQMEELADRKPTQLSGGQQQRVALARAMAIQPDFLLMDEPLSNLDAKLRGRMRGEILAAQRATRITSVYVTHDQEEALTMADRLAVVRDGRIVATGTPRELYHEPPTAWVAGFLGDTNLLSGEVRTRDGPAAAVGCGFGRVEVARAETRLFVGVPVVLSVRPENVRVLGVGDEAPATNVFDAKVRSRTFRGDTEEMKLRLGTREITARARPQELPEVETGGEARVHLPPETVRAFFRDDDESPPTETKGTP